MMSTNTTVSMTAPGDGSTFNEGDTITLEADAKHLLTDVWTSVGLVAGLALATALWTAVQAINAEARASYDAASRFLSAGQSGTLSKPGGDVPLADYVALRRSGWQVSPASFSLAIHSPALLSCAARQRGSSAAHRTAASRAGADCRRLWNLEASGVILARACSRNTRGF